MRLKKREFKLSLPQGEINVVSLMDILTTLLFFLLIAANFTHLSGLDVSGVLSASKAEDNSPKFALEIVFHSQKMASLWLGPYGGLRVSQPEQFNQAVSSQFQGNPTQGYLRKIEAQDMNALMTQVQSALVPIKRGFPTEVSAVVGFADGLSFQEMVDAVSKIRSLDSKAQPFEIQDFAGRKEVTKVLFPQVIISEWSEGT